MNKIDLDKLKQTRSRPALVLSDPNTGKALSELNEVQKRIDALQEAVELGVKMFDNKTTNELLEKSLEQARELQEQGNEHIKQAVDAIIAQVEKIKPVVNVPEQKQKIVNKIVVDDWRRAYIFSDEDKSLETKYYGYVTTKGGWYIMQLVNSETQTKARFVFGIDNYVSNWSDRKKKTYKYLFEAF